MDKLEEEMAAYCIFDIKEVIDSEKMANYRQQVGQSVAHYGGRFLAAGGPFDVVEGNWQPVYPVIIEFPDLETAHQWSDSDEYSEAKALRLEAARADAVFIAGLGSH